MDRRHFLRNALLIAPAARAASTVPFSLEETTLSALEQGFRSRRFTSRSVTEWYLNRIERLDKKGPALGTVIEINPDALAIAAALDLERSAKGPRGPLHGVPVLIKDNFDPAAPRRPTAASLSRPASGPAP